MTTVPFRPSNGTHGEIFMSAFCARCRRDAAHRQDQDKPGCPILLAMLSLSIEDKGYPKELVIDEGTGWGKIGGPDGARCTAFEEGDEPSEEKPYRCPLTPDLFA